MNIADFAYALAALLGVPFLALWALNVGECRATNKWPLVTPIWFLLMPMYTDKGKENCKRAMALAAMAFVLATLGMVFDGL